MQNTNDKMISFQISISHSMSLHVSPHLDLANRHKKIGPDRILKRVGRLPATTNNSGVETNLHYFVVKICYYLHPSHGGAQHNREKCDILGQERNVPADVG